MQRYSVPEEELEVRTIFIAKNHSTRVATETCMLRCDTLRAHGFKLVGATPDDFPWNSKSQTLQMTPRNARANGAQTYCEDVLLVWVWVSLAVFAFHNFELDTGFAVKFALYKNHQSSPRKVIAQKVEILLKPVGVDVESWCAKLADIYTEEDSSNVDQLGLIGRSGEYEMRVSASVVVEKIFNQSVYVLDVMMDPIPFDIDVGPEQSDGNIA